MKPRVKAPTSRVCMETTQLVQRLQLHTVCEEAACPNIGECWSKKQATFMILGDTCTRACRFCNIKTGRPHGVDTEEPQRIAQATAEMALTHVVITSVTRDDLQDGGATQFADTIAAIRNLSPSTTIEVLTPDFLRKEGALAIVMAAKPDVFNHNLETVPRLYPTIRLGARYFHSLNLLSRAKDYYPHTFTKSGLMVGLGESQSEISQVMDDLRCAQVDFLTIGQYLQPTPAHYPVQNFLSQQNFEDYEALARRKGFLMVSASPLTRSSYHAGDDFMKLKAAKQSLPPMHSGEGSK